MTDYLSEVLFVAAAGLLASLSFIPRLKRVRWKLRWSAGVVALCSLLLIGNRFVFPHQMLERDGFEIAVGIRVAVWLVAAVLINVGLSYGLRRWVFPANGQPRARKLFADLLAGLIYLIAGIGILETIFGQSLQGMFAASGILAVFVGLALQNTLADLFAGIALNIERPFRAGDWISMSGGPEGQVLEINWRAARLRTRSGTIVVVPNGVLARSTVTNHSLLAQNHLAAVTVSFSPDVNPQIARDALLEAATSVTMISRHPEPAVSLVAWGSLGITYELDAYVAKYEDVPAATSTLLQSVWATATKKNLPVATPVEEVRIVAGRRRFAHDLSAA